VIVYYIDFNLIEFDQIKTEYGKNSAQRLIRLNNSVRRQMKV